MGPRKKSGYDSKYNRKWSEASAQESDVDVMYITQESFTLLLEHGRSLRMTRGPGEEAVAVLQAGDHI